MDARCKSSGALRMILWEIFAQRRAAFSGVMAAFAIALVIASASHFIPGSKAVPRGILTAAGVILTALVYGLFNFTHLDRKTGQAGFPTRLFVLPVSTRSLVTIPMLAGAISVAVFFAAWWLLVLRQFGIESMILWPSLVLAVTMVCYQATLWSLAAFRTARLLTLSIGGTLLAVIALVPATRDFEGSLLFPSIVVIAIGIGAYLTALVTVERQRHAGGHSAGLRKWLDRVRDLAPARSEPFESAGQAQLWYEMRYAMLLPIITLAIALFVWATSALSAPIPPGVTCYMLGILLLVPFVLGRFVAIGIWTPDRDLPTLVLIRPVSNSELIYTKGKATLLSSFLSWLVLFVIAPMWLLTVCDTSELARIYNAIDQLPLVGAWVIIGLALLFWMLMSWIQMLKPAALALSGRSIVQGIILCAFMLILLTVIIILSNEPAVFVRLGNRLIPFVPFFLFLLVLRFAAKAYFACRLANRLLKRDLVSEEHLFSYGMIWGLASVFAGLVGFVAGSALRVEKLPGLWIPALAALLALNAIPLVRMLLAVKFFESARHR